jgi:membrane fusion protein, multidrug efflux system
MTMNMKAKTIVILICLAIVSCNGGNKQAKLEKLRQQHDKIADQIRTLEEQIKAEKGNKIDSSKVTEVSVTEMKEQPFNHYVEVQGKLDGDENVGISVKMAGEVVAKYADVGVAVHKNQVLAQLDDGIYQKQIKEVKNSLDFATDTYNKQKSLWDQKIGSEMQYLQAKNAKESLEKRMASLEEQVDMLKIKSPINGTIAECSVKVGQLVSPAPNLVVFRVVNFSSLKVVAEVAEAYASKISKGDLVTVFFPDINYTLTSRVTFASDYISPVNRTFVIELRMPSKEKSIKANMVCVLKINDYSSSKAFSLPINVVLNENNHKFVFVAENKIAKKRFVTLGQTYNGMVEITDGLKSGDKVITSGYQKVEEGKSILF